MMVEKKVIDLNAQDLKNSILQLAVQGQLVEQRPEEGTTKELLAQIRAEKQRLIKEKKIKKEQPLPEIAEDEIPFEIPKSWIFVRVGEIGSWSAGATPSRQHPEYYDGDIPWLKTGDLNDGYISEVPEFVGQLALEKTSLRLNPIGSVLMAMYGATIGKLGILKIEATTNQACCACIPYSCIDNKFLFYYLMAQRKNYISMGAGGAQPNISKEKIVMSLIAMPPLAEQKRIVAKIEEILPYIEQYDKAHTKLEIFNKKFPEDMKKSILQLAMQGKLVEQRPEDGTADELYGQITAEKAKLIKEGKIKAEKPLPEIGEDEIPFEIPKSWKWVRWGNLANSIQYGYNASAAPQGDIRMLRISDIQNNIVNWDIVPYCEIPEKEIPVYLLAENDLLFARTGGTVGKSYLVTNMTERAIYAGYLIRSNYNKRLCPQYLKFFMESPLYWLQLRDGTTKTAQPNCNGKTLAKMLIPLPPLAEQKRIVAKIEEILPYCGQLIKIAGN